LKIHTDLLYKKDGIDADVKLDELAKVTKNFTGAEIESLVKSASSYAF
jgi:vesicle-fusing ATPase